MVLDLDFCKIYSYVKDPNGVKYQLVTNKHENVDLDHSNGHKTFIEYSRVIEIISMKILMITIKIRKVKY